MSLIIVLILAVTAHASSSEIIVVEKPHFETFQRVLQTAELLGWEIVAQNPGKGSIDAHDVSKVLGHYDRIKIRLEDLGNKTKVDVYGPNLARLQFFANKLRSRTR